jgi:DNA-binding SARP family transcriptional activator
MPAARYPLPRHHLARPRLVAALRDARVAVVVAGGGYGKTTLAVELARELGIAWALVRLDPGDDDPAALVRRVRDALLTAGLSDAADALEGSDEPPAALDQLTQALARRSDPVLLVLDEIANAGAEGGRLVARLAVDISDHGSRLVLVGRALPPSLTGVATSSETATLGQRDLGFTVEETAELLARVGAWRDAVSAERVRRVTGGWPVATGLAVARLERAADPSAELDRLDADAGLLVGLVDAPLAELAEDVREALLQVAHLPLVSPALADSATGVEGVVAAGIEAGIPYEIADDGSVGLPDPVREALLARASLSTGVAGRAADAYVLLGRGADAIRVLVSAGEADRAAATAASLSPGELSTLDVGELRALLAPIAPAALDRHPRALLHLARAAEASADRDLRTGLLLRVSGLAAHDPALAREVDAERARDLVRDGQVAEAAAIADRLLAEAGQDELQTRVRALHVLGRTHAWRGDAAGLAAAEPLLAEAAGLYGRLGFQTARAHALLALAYDVHTLGGRYAAAVETLEQALAGLPGRSRLRGVVLTFLGEALIDLGRLPEAEAILAEAERLGRLFGDLRTLGFAAWLRARAAASRGDTVQVAERLAEVERRRGAWFDHHSGVEYLAEAALLLDQVGERDAATGYLNRARARAPEALRYVRLAEGVVEARHGDPATAEAALAEVAEMPDLEVREAWRVALLRAYAAQREGDRARAATHARHAFALAAQTEAPDLPLRREPAVAAALLPLVGDRSPASTGCFAVTLLAGFEVRRGADRLELPPGRPTALVKLVAARGGRVQVDEVLEALWPGIDLPSGRKRLRNILNRLRERAGELILRDGDVLVLPEGTEVDASLFEQQAVAALTEMDDAMAPDRARTALGLYTGELLPDDRYEAWAAEPRELARARVLRLLDALVARAEADGDVDEALRLLERGIAEDRLDESRYLRSARLLLRQGRRGRALEVLRAAAAVLRELGLEPSEEHRAVVRSART